MYAVVTTGGKQYRVEAGSELMIERLGTDTGSSITFDRVLLVGDGDAVTIGTPTIDGATVSATILGEALGPKLTVFKFKQKVKYRRMAGHRQHMLRVRIDEISAAGRRSTAAKAESPAKAESKASEATDVKPERTRARTTRKPAGTKTETAAGDAKPARTRRATTKTAEKAGGEAAGGDAEAKPKRTRRPTAKKPSATADAAEAEE